MGKTYRRDSDRPFKGNFKRNKIKKFKDKPLKKNGFKPSLPPDDGQLPEESVT